MSNKKDSLIAGFEQQKKDKDREKQITQTRHAKELASIANDIDTYDIQIKALKKYKG